MHSESSPLGAVARYASGIVRGFDWRTVRRAAALIATITLAGCGAADAGTEPSAVSVDLTPPSVMAVIPQNAATSVAVNTVVAAVFSEPLNASSANGSSFTLVSAQGSTVAGVVGIRGDTATLRPMAALEPNTQYTATVSRDVKDAAGNPLTANYSWVFVTAPAPDVTLPTVIASSPAAGANGVAFNTTVAVTFSEPMLASSLTASSVTLVSAGGTAVSGPVTISGTTVTFAPSANLAPSTQYTTTVTTAAKDTAGNSLASNFTASFTTGAAPDVTPPTIAAITPANGATGVAVTIAPTVRFSEPMTTGSLTTASFSLVASGGGTVQGTVSVEGTTATFTPSSPLANGTQYTATVTTAARDAAGNALAANAAWSFFTAGVADATPPTIAGNTPANNATSVATSVAPTVTFSEPMQSASVNTGSFRLVAAGGATITGSVTLAGNTATFTPAAALAFSTQYTATIANTVRDVAGNALAANAEWSFTTAAAPDVTRPTITAGTPANGATNMPLTTAPQVTFSEPMQNASLTTSSFALRTTTGSVAVAGAVTVSGNSATFTPSAALANGTQYTATITTGARDLAGNALAANTSWSFTTEQAPITSLVITPGTLSIVTGGVEQFTATGRRAGDPNTPVTVAVTYSATGGTITSAGRFTAGSTTGSGYRVTAVLTSNTSLSAQANVTVTAPVPVPTGTWVNVTPGNVNLTSNLNCGNFGTENVGVDPNQPSHFYTSFHCQGIWKSVDYGRTWSGPINTGNNGAAATDCAGGLRVASNGPGNPPILYLACYRGSGTGFLRSFDGGVNWTRHNIAPAAGNRQDVYPPSVDPYDANHLIMAGHEQDLLVESVDGGQTWTTIPVNPAMRVGNGTASISFINTGTASGSRGTWLWMAQQSGGVYGTWRTTNRGASWTRVDLNEHPHGFAEAYQPDANGTVYIAGAYSARGWGVLRSTDYGVTWSHVGMTANQRVVYSTPSNVYSMYSYPTGLGATDGPSFQTAAQPGNGGWSAPATPPAMRQGGSQVAVSTDGQRYYIVSAAYGAGLWLYIEP